MSIYDSIGGAPAVHAAVDDFYARVLADPKLAPFFTGTDMNRLKAHQRAFIAAAIGGPEIFSGRDMAAAHSGLGIADADFDAVVRHLVGTLAGLGVPEETIGQIGSTLAPLRADIVAARKLAGLVPAGAVVPARPFGLVGEPVATLYHGLDDARVAQRGAEPTDRDLHRVLAALAGGDLE
jgi:hemoglobin